MRTLIFTLLWCAATSSAAAQQPAAEPPEVPVAILMANALPAKTVMARAETTPVGSADDAADDPAIWRNPVDPAASLVIGTDKRAGIHVYDMAGNAVSFTPSPRLNNVDLRSGVRINGRTQVLAVASDRQNVAQAAIALFTLDTVASTLVPLGNITVGPGEAYGMCLWQHRGTGKIDAFLVLKDGRIDQIALDLSGAVPTGRVVRRMKLATQSEGCVVDDRTGLLYVAEEDVGLWRFDARASGSTKAVALGRADGKQLVADAEGLAIVPAGRRGGYLVASSQGDYAYVLYRLRDGRYLGRFRIRDGGANGAVDGVQETDGLDVALGNFGQQYPGGMLVVQDGDNAPDTQNFKYISWADVLKSLF